jgi:hypothetical protein
MAVRLPDILDRLKRLSKKAVSGKVLTILISLVIAAVALVLLWAFLTKSTPLISEAVEDIVSGFRKMICKGPLSGICEWALGE